MVQLPETLQDKYFGTIKKLRLLSAALSLSRILPFPSLLLPLRLSRFLSSTARWPKGVLPARTIEYCQYYWHCVLVLRFNFSFIRYQMPVSTLDPSSVFHMPRS